MGTLVSAYIQTQRTSFVRLKSVSASHPITPKETAQSVNIGVSRTIPMMVRDTPMFKICAVLFGVIGWEAEALVKITMDVLCVWMYAETRVYALQTYRQGL